MTGPGSGWYVHRVCAIEVIVVGLCQHFKEVKNALGSAPLTRLRLKYFNRQVGNNNVDSDYDGDNESNDSDTDYNLLDETCPYTIPYTQPVDSTQMTTNVPDITLQNLTMSPL